MEIRKLNDLNNYRLSVVAFIVFYILLTLGCSAQRELQNDTKIKDFPIAPNAININSATADELERIPYIGEKLAYDIVEYREMHGPFRKPEHLMLIPGISDKRFRQIRALIRTE